MGLNRWLITGGCGFIGTSLIKNLISEGGHAVRVLDNLSVGTRDDLGNVCNFEEKDVSSISSQSSYSNSVELIVGDIREYDNCIKACNDADVIVHLAANTGVAPSVKNPLADMTANVIGTFNMLEAARHSNTKRFIFASSGAPIGECTPPIHEELAPHPVSPYGASKLAGEGYCSAYYQTFGLQTVALRFGNVYGPGSGHKNSVVAKFIRQVMNNETLEIYGDGNQTRDFIYIDDLIRAIRFAYNNKSVGGQVFQIATNSETSIKELTNKLLEALSDYGYVNAKVSYTAPKTGDVLRNYSDTSKAKEKLGWYTETELSIGLIQTIEWFRKNKT
ncbi:NAD-dependent epimerase/dehydratase family protein [Desulfobacterales bacterium HSG17]|nr:NAD-dependent epimerase/dehydratase family protein [Desulfobacterales bacterium HSG17]